nr:proteasome A-type subunit-like protein [Cryptomonas paramecium]
MEEHAYTSAFFLDDKTQTGCVYKNIIRSNTIVVLKSKNCVILACKFNFNLLMDNSRFTSKIFIINNKIGIAGTGLYPDLRKVVKRAKRQAQIFKRNFGENISCKELTKQLSSYIQEFTQSNNTRIFGINLFVGGFDIDGPVIYRIDPNGSFVKIKGGSVGKFSNEINEIILKRLSKNLKYEDLLKIIVNSINEIPGIHDLNTNIDIGFVDHKNNFKIYKSNETKKMIQ